MKSTKMMLIALIIATAFVTILPSCKKGDDDPIVSLRTRKDRFTNTWTLVKYEKNGVIQDLNQTSYIYNVFNSGTLNRAVEGSIFGFSVKSISDGTCMFLNDDEDVKIVISKDTTIYNIQRLASKELWLKSNNNGDTFIYYFEGL